MVMTQHADLKGVLIAILQRLIGQCYKLIGAVTCILHLNCNSPNGPCPRGINGSLLWEHDETSQMVKYVIIRVKSMFTVYEINNIESCMNKHVQVSLYG